MTICVGEVIAIEGTRVKIRVFEDSNKDTLFHHGQRFKGVSIREYLTIRRGFKDIVCIVQGEFLDERNYESDSGVTTYIRKVEVKPIGYIEEGNFHEGIKYLPMIKDSAFLMPDEAIELLYTSKGSEPGLTFGKLLKEDIPIPLPWKKLFNTHIGIFGNTGSGKSNTLTQLYTKLFEAKASDFAGRSKFVLLDFNGEYTNNQMLHQEQKQVLRLKTSAQDGDRLRITSDEFWHVDTLSILFQATANTQRPFLNRIVSGREKYKSNLGSLTHYFRSTCEAVFCAAAPKRETLDLLRVVAKVSKSDELVVLLGTVGWHGNGAKFYIPPNQFFGEEDSYNFRLRPTVNNVELSTLNAFEEFTIRAHLQLIRDLISGFVQFDHIQPLLKRAEAAFTHLSKVVHVGETVEVGKTLTVISLRNCNQEIKKSLPLLVAKHYYNSHRAKVASTPDRTLHLIIDEAHNILSEQSAREHEIWRDYRLELFEEIIKEGRKFGMFLTLASQRPADISPTIVSQLHNFFIHRLVNERDLFLIDNTVSTLDEMSKSQIPNLPKGCCIVTGTSFDLPMTLQIDRLDREKQPDSEDVDLDMIWQNLKLPQ